MNAYIMFEWSPSQRDANIPSTVDLNDHLNTVSKDPVPQNIQDSIGFKEKLLYIYTSGTTGMPKVCVKYDLNIVFIILIYVIIYNYLQKAIHGY